MPQLMYAAGTVKCPENLAQCYCDYGPQIAAAVEDFGVACGISGDVQSSYLIYTNLFHPR
jgi:hypothetical protein